MDNRPMLDLERWVRFRWRLQPEIAVGDSKYGTVPNLVNLAGWAARLHPMPDLSQRTASIP